MKPKSHDRIARDAAHDPSAGASSLKTAPSDAAAVPGTAPRWRSLDELEGRSDPRFAGREFPEGASEPVDGTDGVSRRRVLQLVGASSLAGLAACRRPRETIVPYITQPEGITPGIPQQYATTMPFGHSAYGLIVESLEGRPTKIEGNPDDPTTRGGSSTWIQAQTWVLFDPDRSRTPAERATEDAAEGDVGGGHGDAAEHGDGHGHGDAHASAFEERSNDEVGALFAEIRERHAGTLGAGLAVLSEPFSSPSLARAAGRFLASFPQARWVAWEPCSDENVLRAAEAFAVAPVEPVFHPRAARVLVALDDDFLTLDREAPRYAREFADGRRLATPNDDVNRLYVAESAMSPTGAAADDRIAVPPSSVGAVLQAIAAAAGMPGVRPASLDERTAAWALRAANDLAAARGAGLVKVGANQPVEVHRAAFALNAFLGNVGRGVVFREARDTFRSSHGDLEQLAERMRQGGVRDLIVLGGNPVRTAPRDVDFAGALANVERVVHVGLMRDETAHAANWHVPTTHFLEAWGDARGVDGSVGLAQPLIAPLFEANSELELVELLATGEARTGYDIVRETWAATLGASGDFETAWRRALYDGRVRAGDVARVEGPDAVPVFPSLTTAAPDGLELFLRPCHAIHDGRFANVGALQELPDPVTKLTWDNAATLSPRTARDLGVSNGDLVTVSAGDDSVRTVALVVPGQADGTVGMTFGYGRGPEAGRFADGAGFDAYPLCRGGSLVRTGVTVAAAGGTYPLSTTQDHWAIDAIGVSGRDHRMPKLYKAVDLEEYRRHPEHIRDHDTHHDEESIFPDHAYDEGYQWGMAIDLNGCIGCNACVVACQSENSIPVVGKEQVALGREMQWIRVDRYYEGEDGDDPAHLNFQPVTCMHCENAPCEQVCPVAATVHDSEGLNTMVYNRCIGTRYCANNCPYKVRRFNFYNFTKDTPELLQLANNPDVTVRSRGVMEKCTFCVQRLSRAKIDVKLGKTDALEVETACQQACPTRAISFGNLLDGDSEVVRDRESGRAYRMLAEMNNRPRTSYLAKVRNPSANGEEA